MILSRPQYLTAGRSSEGIHKSCLCRRSQFTSALLARRNMYTCSTCVLSERSLIIEYVAYRCLCSFSHSNEIRTSDKEHPPLPREAAMTVSKRSATTSTWHCRFTVWKLRASQLQNITNLVHAQKNRFNADGQRIASSLMNLASIISFSSKLVLYYTITFLTLICL